MHFGLLNLVSIEEISPYIITLNTKLITENNFFNVFTLDV